MKYARQRGPRGRALVAAVVLSMTAFFSVSVASGVAKSGAAKPQLTIGIQDTSVNLDPAKGAVAGWVLTGENLAYEPLIRVNKDQKTYSPGLAASFGFLPAPKGSGLANKRFQFTLRPNMHFSDGTPVTAAAVVKWFQYYRSQGGTFVTSLEPIKSFQVINKLTVRINYAKPNPGSLWFLATSGWGHVASPKAVANPSLLANATYGAGPYKVDPKNTLAGDHYTLVPNPYYYNKSQQYWSKVIVKVISTSTARLQAMQAHEIDILPIGDVSTADAAAKSGFSVVQTPGGTVLWDLNVGGQVSKPLGDVRVRQALNYAVDRKALSQAFAGKYGEPTSGMETLDGWDNKLQNYYPYNPSKARALLAAAGYPNGFVLPELSRSFVGTSWGTVATQAVAKYLDAVGVKVQIQVASTDAEFRPPFLAHTYPMWDNNIGVVSMGVLWQFYQPGGVLNGPAGKGWNDPTLDHLAVSALRAKNPSKYYEAMTRRMVQQADMLPAYVLNNVGFLNPKKVHAGALIDPLSWRPA